MDKLFCVMAIVVTATIPIAVIGQTHQTPFDRYFETGKSILLVKCLTVGPINILMRSNVTVEVLQVVKGKESRRTLTANSQYEMKAGGLYMIRTENEADTGDRYFAIETIDSAIAIAPYANMDLLSSLPPRVVVKRIINLRIEDLENKMRRDSYEIEALKSARLDQ